MSPSGGSGDAGAPGGGSSDSLAGSGTADGGDTGGTAGTETGGTAGTETGGTAGTETGGTAGTGAGGTAGTETGGTAGTGAGGTAGTGAGGPWGGTDLLCGALGNLDESSAVILNLGLTRPIQWFERTDDRLLATAEGASWALWDLSDKDILAEGDAGDRIVTDLAGDLFTLVSATQLEVRSLRDGSLITAVATPSHSGNHGGLSRDGSYYWSATADSIKAWDASGTLLLTKDGDYTQDSLYKNKSLVSADPDELRIALGPAGKGVIERISIDTGASTTSAFAGTFRDWFLDGGRFLTGESGTVRVYAADTTTQEAFVELPVQDALVGQGDYFWTFAQAGGGTELLIYAVADPSSPAARYTALGQSYQAVGNRIALIHSTEVTVVELDPTEITDSTVDLPPAPAQWMYTSDAAGNYAFANQRGVVYDAADLERPLSCGQALGMTGSKQGTLAVSTSVGLLLFELTPDSRSYLGNIPFPSSVVSLSSDGSVLAAGSLHGIWPSEGLGDTALALWSLPDRVSLLTRSYPPGVLSLELSALGNRFSYTIESTRKVEDLAGNVSLTLGGSERGLLLSPDGSRAATREGSGLAGPIRSKIYENGTLIDALTGAPALWLDQSHLLVNVMYDRNNPDFQTGGRIYAIPGGFQPGPKLGSFGGDAAMLSPTEVYTGGSLNSVYSLSTGELLWSGDPADFGAVASGNIVIVRAHQVVIDE